MARLILFNKPYGVLSQFTPEAGHGCLKDYLPMRKVYPAGRLDADSEGLLVLTDSGVLQARIAQPRHKLAKIYWTQVEGEPDDAAIQMLCSGLDLGDFITGPCLARLMTPPSTVWPRDPPVRKRLHIPTAWLELTLREGKNRQVRRMTAKVGHPTLRLIRWAVGDWTLDGLDPGQWREIEAADP